jgi:two-component system NarL family sensor kinase
MEALKQDPKKDNSESFLPSNEELLFQNKQLTSANLKLQSLNEDLCRIQTENKEEIKRLKKLNGVLKANFKSADLDTLEKLIQQQDVLMAITNTQEAERIRIGESLHNGLGQILYTVKLKLEGIGLDTNPNILKKINQEAQALLLEAIKETRLLSSELMPTILEDYGLECALESICKKLKDTLKVKCKVQGFQQRLDAQFEIAIFRIIQELANNIIKHSSASSTSISLIHSDGLVTIKVKDNGKGFDVNKQIPGIGLSSIKNRVKLLSGQLKITSKPNSGTFVCIVFRL